MLSFVVKGAEKTLAALAQEDRRQKRALVTALKREGYLRAKELQREVRAGAPGGQAFAPMSKMFGVMSRLNRRHGYAKGFIQSGNLIQYDVMGSDENAIVSVGWPTSRVPGSFRKLMADLQEGKTTSVSAEQRRFFAGVAGQSGSRTNARKYLFLKRSTSSFRMPGRPVITPYYNAHRSEFLPSIRKNWIAKMKGQRI